MKITIRDIALFWWMNSCGAVTLAQIAGWMAVDYSTAARRVRILIKAGLLRRLNVPFLISGPIVPTAAACSLAGDPLLPLRGVRVGTWRHDSLLVDIERKLEIHFGGWIELERRIRVNRKFATSSVTHTPDGIVHCASGRLVAVELELSAKAPARLQKIVDHYAASTAFERVAYITDDAKLAAYLKRFTAPFDFISVQLYRTPQQRAAVLPN